jgi:hypothetical protein
MLHAGAYSSAEGAGNRNSVLRSKDNPIGCPKTEVWTRPHADFFE